MSIAPKPAGAATRRCGPSPPNPSTLRQSPDLTRADLDGLDRPITRGAGFSVVVGEFQLLADALFGAPAWETAQRICASGAVSERRAARATSRRKRLAEVL